MPPYTAPAWGERGRDAWVTPDEACASKGWLANGSKDAETLQLEASLGTCGVGGFHIACRSKPEGLDGHCHTQISCKAKLRAPILCGTGIKAASRLYAEYELLRLLFVA
ncbi:hypothetical protein VFPBJ_05145 [Purpureocillium lilacinum]|uniref:Uncharacterized protein n=1 Tax=Purpureocillium lilacinum TaxID=33203 RepID=A0A179GQC5_PURLI|nr:hypothetical protein VFPBJ_05145 [Purpureocillium lilacinum]